MGYGTSVTCSLSGILNGKPFQSSATLVGYTADSASVLCEVPLPVATSLQLKLNEIEMEAQHAQVQANKGDSGIGYRLELKLARQWPFEVQKILMTMTMAEPLAGEKKAPTPPCLQVLGLELPCTGQMVEDAFREQVRKVHPDRGGDVEEFVRLRGAYLEALDLLDVKR